MSERQRAVGIFHSSSDTEVALQELDKSRFSLDRVFVIARNRDQESQIVESDNLCSSLRDRFESRINSTASQDHSMVEGKTEISLAKALIHLDIPGDAARLYNDLVAKGEYLVMVEGSNADITGSETILKRSGIQEWVIYTIAEEHPEVIIVDRRHS